MISASELDLRSQLFGTASGQREINIGYFIFAFAALAIAYGSMSLVHSTSLPVCEYTPMGDVSGDCH